MAVSAVTEFSIPCKRDSFCHSGTSLLDLHHQACYPKIIFSWQLCESLVYMHSDGLIRQFGMPTLSVPPPSSATITGLFSTIEGSLYSPPSSPVRIAVPFSTAEGFLYSHRPASSA